MTANVCAIVLAHDQPQYLARVLANLKNQSITPSKVLVVDTSEQEPVSNLGFEVLKLDSKTGFAAAIDAAVMHLAAEGYLWILHDDSAPDERALEFLLREVELSPSLAIVGPKQVDWENPKIIKQLGLTLTRAGRLFSRVRGEFDQGQHDHAEDVMAVGTAGALVNVGVYHSLGGFDKHAPVYASDVDFSIRARLSGFRVAVAPNARVSHKMLSMQGARPLSWLGSSPATAIRQAELHLALSYANPALFFLGWLLLLPAAVLNSLLLVLRSRAHAITPEITASFLVFLSLKNVLVSRSKIRQSTSAKIGTLSTLRATVAEVRNDNKKAKDEEVSTRLLTSYALGETEVLQVAPNSGLLASGAIWWALGLVALNLPWVPTNVAVSGSGVLPISSNWLEIFGQAGSNSHSIGLGFVGAADPWVWALSLLSAPLFFLPPLAITLFMFLATPIAFVGFFKLSELVSSKNIVRIFSSLAYALWPALTTAISQAKFSQLLAIALLPWLLYSLARVARIGQKDSTRFPRTHVGIAAILLAMISSSSPVLGVVLLAMVIATAVMRPTKIVPLIGSTLLALSWFLPLVIERAATGNWLTLLLDPGLSVEDLLEANWKLAFFGFGFESLSWGLLITVPILFFALLALLAPKLRNTLPLWAIALVALGASWVVVGVDFDLGNGSSIGIDVTALLGLFGLALALLLAHLASTSLLLRISSLATVTLLGLVPAAFQVVTDPPDLSYSDGRIVPSIIQAEVGAGSYWRTLELESSSEGGLVAQVFSGDGVKLNHISSGYKISSTTNPTVNPDYQELGQLVANLASANGAEIFPTLEKLGIGYILVNPVDRNLQLALDSTRELESIGLTDFGQLWKVDEITAGSQAQPLELGFTKLGQLALLILFVWFAIPTRRRKKRKTKDSEIFIDSEEASY
jgi:GT2 family glycosyltransferase